MFKNKISIIILGLTALAFVIWSSVFIYKTSFVIDGVRYYSLFDDAMISMKYAWQFAHGNGLVWNDFGKVEGYTNPLWTIIMSLFILVFGLARSVLSIQVLGIFIILGIAYVAIRIVDITNFLEKRYMNMHAIFVVLFIFTYYPLLYWTLMGMETGFLTLLILISVFCMLRYLKLQKLKDVYLMSLFLSLSYLTRPDSIVLAIAILGTTFILSFLKIKKSEGKKFIGVIAFYVLVVAAHTLFRKYYYGELIPNTVTLKVFGLSTWFRVENGFRFIIPFMKEIALLIIFAAIYVIQSPGKIKYFFSFLFLSACFYQVFVGGDSWNYWRFLVPVMPFLFILASAGILQSIRYVLKCKTLRSVKKDFLFIASCLIITTSLIYVHNKRFLKQMFFRENIFSVEYNAINTNFALRLKEVSKPKASVGVIWAGAIPYYSERDGIDFLGKSDKYIAHLKPDLTVFTSVYGMKTLPGHNKYDLQYSIIKLRPDVIERADWANQSVYTHPKFIYENVSYKDVTLHIKKGSKNIYWDKIKNK